MSLVREFFQEIDRQWSLPHDQKIPLRVIGSAALMLQTGYERGTKDSDVIETAVLSPPIKQHLLALASKQPESKIFQKYRMYVDVVPSGLPFLPQTPRYHLLGDLNATLAHLEIEVLDTVDVVVSKLIRFHANDRSDIDAMVDRGLVDKDRLVERFRAAVDPFTMDARASELPKIIENFHHVQTDMLVTEETEIELPHWLE